jgi:hypothetical protein
MKGKQVRTPIHPVVIDGLSPRPGSNYCESRTQLICKCSSVFLAEQSIPFRPQNMTANVAPCDNVDLRAQLACKAMPRGFGEVNGMSDPGTTEVDCCSGGRQ